jgi:hypothetical protein
LFDPMSPVLAVLSCWCCPNPVFPIPSCCCCCCCCIKFMLLFIPSGWDCPKLFKNVKCCCCCCTPFPNIPELPCCVIPLPKPMCCWWFL